MYGEHGLAVWLSPHLASAGHDATLIDARRSPAVLRVTLLTFVHIVLGEMVPKSLALQHPTASRASRTGRCA